MISGYNIIWISLLFSIGLNLVFFLFAYLLKTDKFTDITYATTFVGIYLISWLLTSDNVASYSNIIGFSLVLLWAIRLGGFLLIRVSVNKKDARFDEMRGDFLKFLRFWLLQAIVAWLILFPIYILHVNNVSTGFQIWSIIPIILTLTMLVLETVSDFQKFFWKIKGNKGFISKGLWKYSRHPNYFFEYTFWIFFYAFTIITSINNLNYYYILGLIGPIVIIATLYKASGVPILEKNGFAKYGTDPSYLQYLDKTPCVIPFIGKKGLKEKYRIVKGKK
jgi:steroid 5-alpha reductase family enzyme